MSTTAVAVTCNAFATAFTGHSECLGGEHIQNICLVSLIILQCCAWSLLSDRPCGHAGQVEVEQARVCYGGVAPKCLMATNTQAALEGQPWTQATLDAALLAVAKDVNITPDAPG